MSASGFQLKKPVEVARPKPDINTASHGSDKKRIALADGAISLDAAVAKASRTNQVVVVSS